MRRAWKLVNVSLNCVYSSCTTLTKNLNILSGILKFQRKWELGLKIVEEATLTLPKATSHHLIKHKLMFKSRMGKSVEGDIMIFSVSFICLSNISIWYMHNHYKIIS